MHLRNKLLTTALLAVIAPAAMAADTATLQVKGDLTPSACVPAFTGGAILDFGAIPTSTLNGDATTRLPIMQTTITVTCAAATKIALNGVDNRLGTAAAVSDHWYGLGLSGAEKIGHYHVNLNVGTVDGVAQAEVIGSIDNGATWHSNASSLALKNDGTAIVSQAAVAGTDTPTTGQVFVYPLVIDTYIAPANTLTLTSNVPLDGFATLEVIYL